MPLTKSERAQLDRQLDAITESADKDAAKTTAPAGEQGAPPREVTDFTDRAMGENQKRTPEQEAAYDRAVANSTNKKYEGISGVRASGLSPADLVFMRHLEENATFRHHQAGKGTPDVFQALLVGTEAEINQARNGSKDRADVQGERSKFSADPGAWVDAYNSSNSDKLRNAYNRWISELGV